MQSIFVQEDGTLDSEASIFLGLLMKNKISKFDLEMICGVHFQGKGDNREIGVSLATAITEASVQKFIQVLRKQHGKLNAHSNNRYYERDRYLYSQHRTQSGFWASVI